MLANLSKRLLLVSKSFSLKKQTYVLINGTHLSKRLLKQQMNEEEVWPGAGSGAGAGKG